MVKLYVIQALCIYPAFIMLKFKRMEVIVAGDHQRHVTTKPQYCQHRKESLIWGAPRWRSRLWPFIAPIYVPHKSLVLPANKINEHYICLIWTKYFFDCLFYIVRLIFSGTRVTWVLNGIIFSEMLPLRGKLLKFHYEMGKLPFSFEQYKIHIYNKVTGLWPNNNVSFDIAFTRK